MTASAGGAREARRAPARWRCIHAADVCAIKKPHQSKRYSSESRFVRRAQKEKTLKGRKPDDHPWWSSALSPVLL